MAPITALVSLSLLLLIISLTPWMLSVIAGEKVTLQKSANTRAPSTHSPSAQQASPTSSTPHSSPPPPASSAGSPPSMPDNPDLPEVPYTIRDDDIDIHTALVTAAGFRSPVVRSFYRWITGSKPGPRIVDDDFSPLSLVDIVSVEIAGNTVLDYLSVVFFCFYVYVLLQFVKQALRVVLIRLSKHTETDIDDFLVTTVFQHISHEVLLISSILLSIQLLSPEHASIQKIDAILRSIVLCVISHQAVEVILKTAQYALSRYDNEQKGPPLIMEAMENVSKVLRMLFWLLAFGLTLDHLGLNVYQMFASLGIGGIAVALTARTFIEDAVNALCIYVDKPFVVGDSIMINDLPTSKGDVLHVGLKSTRLRAKTGELLVYSNSTMATARIRNFSHIQKRKTEMRLTLHFDTPLPMLKAMPSIIRKVIDAEQKTKFARCFLEDFVAYGLSWKIVYHVQENSYDKFCAVVHKINFGIMEAMEANNIRFAIPTQSIHMIKHEEVPELRRNQV